MSLRGFFSRNIVSHRRRKSDSASSALASGVEFLEDRVLLSVDSPLLQNHGVAFANLNVLDPNVQFFAVNNPLYSNNAGGSGLSVALDGSSVFGNPPATPVVPQLSSVVLSPNLGPLAFNNNANTGATISLSNLTLDVLRIDASTFDANGRSGLVINLNNVQIGQIVIVNSVFTNNANDGLCILGNASSVDTIILSGNNFSNNSAGTFNDGAFLQFRDSRLGNVLITNNNFNDNGANGVRLDLDNTTVSSLEFLGNNLNGNSRNGNGSGAFFDFQDSDVDGTVTGNAFTNNTFTPNPFNPNLTQGDGLRIQMRRSILPDGTTAPGLRNLDLDRIGGNTVSGNGGAGVNVDLGQNTTFRSAVTGNQITSNGQAGFNLMARDTRDAFDVQIGGETLDPQNNNLDANTIDGNRGAGIAITLDDTSNVAGNTSGRFNILNNVITNTQDDNLLLTEFAGEGLFVRARGSIALVNGAARLLNSRVDGNTITGNASHGIAFDISEDSEVLDLLIGDVFKPGDPSELPEGDGFRFQNQIFRNSGNQVQNNGGDGLSFLRRDAALARDVRIIDNLFNGNANGIGYTVRNDDNVVNTVTIQHNDVTNNTLSGVQISTQIDASLIATIDNNLISGNAGDGILTLGFEGDPTDAENLGGTWTRNTIQGNLGTGVNLNGVPGTITPLVIGLQGTDSRGNSLGNLINGNGDDGIEINAPGFVDIVNNLITFNGQNNTTQNVHGDGKGIDINLITDGALETFLGFNVIQGNFGDGLEILSRALIGAPASVSLRAIGNIIDLNLGRGVDLLNSGDAEMYVVFGDGTTGPGSSENIIRSNGLEGFYVVNTASFTQSQSADATAALAADGNPERAPNLTLDLNGNDINQNGLPANGGQLNGSGLVIRVGTTGSRFGQSFTASALPDYDGVDGPGFNSVGTSNSAEIGNGRVNARVNNNTFGGNLGVDVITESFVSTPAPAATAGTWNGTMFTVTGFQSDPMARLNLEFTNNTGQSVDMVRLGAFYNNTEGNFKSRTANRTAPDPNGPFGADATRFRNAQRLPGRGDPDSAPDAGFGGLGLGAFGSVLNVIPGSGNTPIQIVTNGPHGLFDGDHVLISAAQIGPFSGFSLDNIFEITVINAQTFALNDTEGETDVDEFNSSGAFYALVTNFDAFLYPGIGPSTFRLIEFGNSFPEGNDIDDSIAYIGGGNGHYSYTFDREEPGSFNFRTLSISDAQVTEGGNAEFTITLSEALPTADLEIIYSTAFAGSAIGDVDYTSATLETVTLPAGATTVTISIPTLPDNIFEPTEFFKVFINSATATFADPFDPFSGFTEEFATPVNQFGLGTILDDDSLPSISISDAGGFEKGDGTVGIMEFQVTLSNPSDSPVFVDFVTSDFTANVDVDYRFRQGTLTFAPGETMKTITIEILSDALFPTPGSDVDQETLFVNLSAPNGATLADSQGQGTIFEPRFVTIFDASADGEGDSPSTSIASFLVTLTDVNGDPSFVPAGQTITVNYDTVNGSAIAGSDFVGVSGGVLTFNQFDSQMTLPVTVNRDRVFEGDENFSVTISSPRGTIERGTATGNILESLEVASTRDATGQAVVQVFDYRTGIARFNINPYPGFLGEARIATADFNGDGIMDIVTAPGPGGGPHVRVLNGIDGSSIFEFMAYAPGFTGGVFVATGDVNNDGRADIITGPDMGGGPHVRVFDGTSTNLIEDFIALGLGADFVGGVRVASGNANGVGGDEIILGYGPGRQPLVEVYSSDGFPITLPTLDNAFFAYDPNFEGGLFVSAADIGGGALGNPDGLADIITGTGIGAPHVRVFSGASPNTNPNSLPADLESFFAYSPGFVGGVRVASGDVSNDLGGNPTRDRVAEVLTAPGFGGGPHVRAFSVDGNIATTPPMPVGNGIFPFATNLTSGTYIAGRTRGFSGQGSPLMLDAQAVPGVDQADALTEADLQPVIAAALDRLRIAGVSDSAVSRLSELEFVIADLDGAGLGLQSAGRILIDRTAAGRGYFIDLTPGEDEEFSLRDGRLLASDDSATGRVDLLTVVLHELGHALGAEHTDGGHDLLAPTLLPGERRLPEFDTVFADQDTFQALLSLN